MPEPDALPADPAPIPGAVPAPTPPAPYAAQGPARTSEREPASALEPALEPAPESGPAAAAQPGFAPDAEWRRVSPKYVVVEVVGSIVTTLVIVAALLAASWFWGLWWAPWAAGAVAVVAVVGIALEPRRVRAIGYRLRDDDLLFRRGIMFQRQVSVPYGRMQLVDITRGPVARALGLAELKFVTAAAATAVTVPGLPEAEADRLRDELVALAESRRAGL